MLKMIMKSKNKEKLDKFTAFCKDNPSLRFYQALLSFENKRNVSRIYFEIYNDKWDDTELKDTFYLK